jgi:hypothetical protein
MFRHITFYYVCTIELAATKSDNLLDNYDGEVRWCIERPPSGISTILAAGELSSPEHETKVYMSNVNIDNGKYFFRTHNVANGYSKIKVIRKPAQYLHWSIMHELRRPQTRAEYEL